MRKLCAQELKREVSTHIFEGILPGIEIYQGGMFFMKAGEVSHANDGGSSVHVHEDCELFYFMQGKAVVEIDKEGYPAAAGDIFLVEPGEDHHILAGKDEIPVGIWCHARL